MSNERHVFMFSNQYFTLRAREHGVAGTWVSAIPSAAAIALQNGRKRLDLDARLVVERAQVALGAGED